MNILFEREKEAHQTRCLLMLAMDSRKDDQKVEPRDGGSYMDQSRKAPGRTGPSL
jgi:hypothetical protein